VEKLRKHLADLVANGSITIHTDKGGNGQSIELYRLTNGNTSNICNSNVGNRGNSNETTLKITGTFDIALEGWQAISNLLSSLINIDGGNSGNDNENNAMPFVTDCEESDISEIDDDDIPVVPSPPQPTPVIPAWREALPPRRTDTLSHSRQFKLIDAEAMRRMQDSAQSPENRPSKTDYNSDFPF